MEVGSSVSTDFSGNTAINTYAAPFVRHEIDDQWAVSMGVVTSQTFLDGWKSYSIEGPLPSTIYSNAVFGRVEYKVDEKLLLYGSAYQNVVTMPSPGYDRVVNGSGYSLGARYKMSRNSFIQVEMHRSTGISPYVPYNNRFGAGLSPFSFYP
jgi:hypothetical protein